MRKNLYIASLLLVAGGQLVFAQTATSTTTVLAPIAPSSVIAEIHLVSISGGSGSIPTVVVNWRDNSSNETGFKVSRARVGESLSTLTTVPQNSNQYTDTSVTAGMSYIYVIQSCVSAACSSVAYSSTVTIPSTSTSSTSDQTIIPDGFVITSPLAPSAPTAPTVHLSTSGSVPNITILWTDTSTNETGFKIIKAVSGTSPVLLTTVGTNVSSFVDTAVSPGMTYTYAIQSCSNELCSASTYTASLTVPLSTSVVVATTTTVRTDPLANSTVLTTLETHTKKITGTVSFPNDTLVTDAEIGAYNKSTGTWLSKEVASDGRYTLLLSYGTWELKVRPKSSVGATWSGPSPVDSVSFSSENSDETIAKNFIVAPLSSHITVVVNDELTQQPISGIGVVIDTVSSSQKDSSLLSSERKIKTEITNTYGSATISSQLGTYFIRVAIPESLNYQGIEERSVTLLSGETKTIAVRLKKVTPSTTSVISGVTKFDNETPTSAYVYAWSDNGDSEHTVSSNVTGAFSLTLSANKTWHLSAHKDSGTQSYKTTEILLDTSTSTNPLNLVFSMEDTTVLPEPVLTKKTSSDQVTLIVKDGASFSLPPNAVTETGPINVEVKPTTEALSYSSSQVVSTVYDITVKNTDGVALTKLSSEAEIVIPYDEAELAAQGVSIESMVPSYFDENLGAWISVPKFTINKEKKVVVLHVDHLTRFALIASADVTPPPSPTNIVADYATPQDIKITWANPLSDFHHSKIYKSLSPGVLGDVIATEVLTNSFTDKTYTINGKTYYYTVRAVDRAGNESSNLNQVLLVAKGDSTLLANKRTDNSLLLPPGQTSTGQASRVLIIGKRGSDVTELQKFLKKEGFYPKGRITGYFGPMTKKAVQRFQTKYASEILTPNGFRSATGMVGTATRQKMNEIIASEVTP